MMGLSNSKHTKNKSCLGSLSHEQALQRPVQRPNDEIVRRQKETARAYHFDFSSLTDQMPVAESLPGYVKIAQI